MGQGGVVAIDDWEADLCGDGWSCVDRRLVHRASISEVFVTRLRTEPEAGWVVDAQWPRHHPLYVRPGTYSPSIFLESFRQAVILANHVVFKVPLDSAFIMCDIWIEMRSRTAITPGPSPSDVQMLISPGVDSPMGKTAVEWTVDFTVDGRTIASGGGTLRVLPRNVYNRLRRLGRPNGAISTRRRGGPGTCIAVEGDDVLLAADPHDPILFDHVVDHVPAMVLLEAVLELVRRERPEPVIGLAATFDSFVEIDRDCRLVSQRVGSQTRVTFEQDGSARGFVAACFDPGAGRITGTPMCDHILDV